MSLRADEAETEDERRQCPEGRLRASSAGTRALDP